SAAVGCHERDPSAHLLPQLLLRAALFPGLSRHLGQRCRRAHRRASLGRSTAALLSDRRTDLRSLSQYRRRRCRHGWLPHWVIRLGEMTRYVSGATPPLKYHPIEYVQMGRFRCGAEPFEGPAMTKAVIDILGPDVLMHQSDYPHGEAHFPDTAQMVLDWPIWNELGRDLLQQHMAGNAEKFLRMA